MTNRSDNSCPNDKSENDVRFVATPGTWPVNNVTGRQEPPDLDWIIRRLLQIKSRNCPDNDLYNSAISIHFIWRMMRLYGKTYSIGEDVSGRCFADSNTNRRGRSPLPARIGPAKELRALEIAASSGSLRRWLTAWAATPHETQVLVWKPQPPPVHKTENGAERGIMENVVSFSAPGFSFIAPKACDALPYIRKAASDLKLKSPLERKKPRRPQIIRDLWIEMSAIYTTVSHNKAHYYHNNLGSDVRSNSFIDLVRDLDTHFKTGLIGGEASRLRQPRKRKSVKSTAPT